MWSAVFLLGFSWLCVSHLPSRELAIGRKSGRTRGVSAPLLLRELSVGMGVLCCDVAVYGRTDDTARLADGFDFFPSSSLSLMFPSGMAPGFSLISVFPWKIACFPGDVQSVQKHDSKSLMFRHEHKHTGNNGAHLDRLLLKKPLRISVDVTCENMIKINWVFRNLIV